MAMTIILKNEIMKRIFRTTILLTAALLFVLGMSAQPLHRKAETKIADALNQLPADNAKLYERLMSDIASTGTQGVELLLAMLQRNDDSRTKVEYALDAYAAYAGRADFNATSRDSLRTLLRRRIAEIDNQLTGNEAKDASEHPSMVTTRALLVRMQRYVSGYQPDAALPLPDVDAACRQLVKTLKQKSRTDRMNAINIIDTYGSASQAASSLSQAQQMLPKLSDDAKVDVMYWMRRHSKAVDTRNVAPLLWSDNAEVAQGAAWLMTAVGNVSDAKAIAALLKGSSSQRLLAETCLKSFPGHVTDAVTDAVGTALTPEALAVIASRMDSSKRTAVMTALHSSDDAVSLAAYKALPSVVGSGDLTSLFTELELSAADRRTYVQDAIIAALGDRDRSKQHAAIAERMSQADPSQRQLYMPLLVRTADMPTLMRLGREFADKEERDMQDLCFEAYFASITDNMPGARRLQLLRNAMDIASPNVDNMCRVLAKVAAVNVMPAVIYAGRFLDDSCTRQAAAQAIRVLTSGHDEINGPEVVALMREAMNAIEGPDADYQKTEIQQQLDRLSKADTGYVSLFNGTDLTGWKGLLAPPYDNPYRRRELDSKTLKALQQEADKLMSDTWKAHDGVITFNGKGRSIATVKEYGNFEMYIDWRLLSGLELDAGIYLRGTPQVQIWDIARTNVGAEVGSGGLYNNHTHPSKPLRVADNALEEWNTFYIRMVDERVTVWLNGVLVTDNVVLENFWDRSLPLLLKEQIELQAHGSVVEYRDIYIHELPQTKPVQLSADEQRGGFKLLFDGTNLSNFQGDFVNYRVDDGTIHVKPRGEGFGNLYTKEQYENFVMRFEFKLTPGANNGVGVRADMGKDAAYYGMEIQVLDHFNEIYQPGLHDYQYHGSVYGIIPTQNRNCLRPVGEWNEEEIYIKGTHVRVTLNGTVITEGDIKEAVKNGTYDGNEHPGLFNKTGYIGFLGHGSELWFRNVRIKRL